MKVLLVEDEPGISHFVKQGLEEEAFKIDVAEDGYQGLKLALSGAYDLLLLDWMLPGINGIAICKTFRKEFKKTPIIFLTAKDTVEETIEGLQSGANDYIKKPFHFSELLERIRVQLRNSHQEENGVLSVGKITLNKAAHQVFKNEEEIHLTQREFDLLRFLLEQKGKVCKRTEIIKQVWDIHFDYDTSVIDVYINALRKKLKLDEKENYIRTIRGVGYSINE